MDTTRISLIICSRDDEKFSRVSEMYRARLDGGPLEIVRIADAAGMCEGYNRGVAAANGDVLVFSHDDVMIFADDFRRRLLGHLEHCDLLGFAGTTRLCSPNWHLSGPPFVFGQFFHPAEERGYFEVSVLAVPSRRVDQVQALDGAFFCCKREVAQDIRFDQETFRGFHFYDLDFSFRAHQRGWRVSIANDLDLFHESAGNYDEQWKMNAALFHQKHQQALAPKFPHRMIHFCHVRVPTIEDALSVMRPAYWP